MIAAHGAKAEEASLRHGDLQADLAIGMMNGQGRELVLDPATGSVVSRLDWNFDRVVMARAGLAYNPLDWLTLGIKGATNLTDSSHMNDYDFNVSGCPASADGGSLCESNHPDTLLQHAFLLDLSASAKLIDLGHFSAGPVVGFKWETYKWHANNGTSNYAGVFNDGLGISYDQWWETPYLGVSAEAEIGRFGLSARAIGSRWGEGQDRDLHHSRSLLFKETFEDVTMAAGDINLTYRISGSTRLALGYGYEQWLLAKGPTTIADLLSGASAFIPGDSAAGGLYSQTVSLGVAVDLSRARSGGESLKDEGGTPAPAWSGLHLGGALGAVRQDAEWTTTGIPFFGSSFPVFDTTRADLDATGAWVGGFAGYDWQHGPLVLGIEVDAGKANANETVIGIPGTSSAQALAGSPDSVVLEADFDASLRLRAGILIDPSLLGYVTAGLAWQQAQTRVSCSTSASWCSVEDAYQSQTHALSGWTAGAGLEAMLADGLFLRGEYRYTDVEDIALTLFPEAPDDTVSASIETASHRATAGLGIRF